MVKNRVKESGETPLYFFQGGLTAYFRESSLQILAVS